MEARSTRNQGDNFPDEHNNCLSQLAEKGRPVVVQGASKKTQISVANKFMSLA